MWVSSSWQDGKSGILNLTVEQGCSQGATETCNRTWAIQCIYKWSGKEINNKLASAAKINFFRTVVTKTVCEELQEYFAALNHLKIRKKKKKLYSVSDSTVLHMKENNSCYIHQKMGSKLNFAAQETNVWGHQQ